MIRHLDDIDDPFALAPFRQDPAFVDVCERSKAPNQYIVETQRWAFPTSRVIQQRRGPSQCTILAAQWRRGPGEQNDGILFAVIHAGIVREVSYYHLNEFGVPLERLPARVQSRLLRLARRAGLRDLRSVLSPQRIDLLESWDGHVPASYVSDLRVFTCDCDEWVVALSPEDAAAVWNEQCGGGFLLDGDEKPVVWEECPPSKTMNYSEDESLPGVRKTFAELAKMNGRGYLASGNW